VCLSSVHTVCCVTNHLRSYCALKTIHWKWRHGPWTALYCSWLTVPVLKSLSEGARTCRQMWRKCFICPCHLCVSYICTSYPMCIAEHMMCCQCAAHPCRQCVTCTYLLDWAVAWLTAPVLCMCHVQATAPCVFTQASGESGLGTRLVSSQDMTSEGASAVHVYSHLSSRIVATVRDSTALLTVYMCICIDRLYSLKCGPLCPTYH